MTVAPSRPRPDAEHAGDGTGAEGHPQGAGHAAALGGGRRRAHVAPHGHAHADEAGQAREGRPEEEADDPVEAGLGEGERGRRRRGCTTLVAVKKMRTASGTTMMPMVLN